MENSINHFSHPKHPLKLYNGARKPWDSSECVICGEQDSFYNYKWTSSYEEEESFHSIYGCRECRFKIHLDCAELPGELTHPFHPQHSLFLYPIGSPEIHRARCNACGRTSKPAKYACRCSECKFILDIHCLKLQPLNDDLLKHQKVSHQHRVFVCNQPSTIYPYCSFCYSRFSKTDLIYVCVDCRHSMHESCVFPKEIVHPFHLKHPLLLVPPSSYTPFMGTKLGEECNACSQSSSEFFTCSECEFFLDLSCISLKPTCRTPEYDQELQNQPLTHPHPLIQCDPIKDQRLCSGCVKPIKDSIYVCLECGILLDQSCAWLLPEITSPFHPIHPLTLRRDKGESSCRLCYHCTHLLKYECRECNFLIDTRCATSTKPYAMVNSRMHHHPLAFFVEKPGYDWGIACETCGKPCEKYFFSCPDCSYCIHLDCCSSLPLVIKHESHCDPLIFTDSLIKDASDEDSDNEFYCHACEDLRDLDDPTYYCQECHFVAHLHCVLPAILLGLESEPTASSTSS